MKRKIIKIDEDKCTGCGLCIPNCPEGAIQMIDGKARLISDLCCDGLGACLGHCPEGAVKIEEREAEPYDERKVMENVIKHGPNVIKAHLAHLKDHKQDDFYATAIEILDEKGMQALIEADRPAEQAHPRPGGCPGMRSMRFAKDEPGADGDESGHRRSQLGHWPVQLHLMSPAAPHYRGADVLLAADCTAYALGDFHRDYLKGKALAIACPKLDSEQQIYEEKIRALIDEAKINTLTVMIMEVPCCSGLLRLVEAAAASAERKAPVKCVVVGIQGKVLREEWM